MTSSRSNKTAWRFKLSCWQITASRLSKFFGLLVITAGSTLGCATTSSTPPSETSPSPSPSPAGNLQSPSPLSEEEEEELAALLTRALVSDEEQKSRAQDEGRYRQLTAKLTADLVPADHRDAAACAQLQLQARGLLGTVRGLRDEERRRLQGKDPANRAGQADLSAFVASAEKRGGAYQLSIITTSLASVPDDAVIARAIGREKTLVGGDVWELLGDGSTVNATPGCPAPLSSDMQRTIKRKADQRLMALMKRRAPDVAVVMEQNQIIRRCRRLGEIARLRLRAFYVSQELFFAENERYALLSELPPQALPAPREQDLFQFDLVSATPKGFVFRATGRGETHAAGTLWEIDQMGVAHEVIRGCVQKR